MSAVEAALAGRVAAVNPATRAARTGVFTPAGMMIATLATIVGFQMLLHAMPLVVGSAAGWPLQATATPARAIART